jgi:phosphoserine aminotransferase
VWIVNDRCLEKAKSKLAAGHSIGAYQALPNLLKNAQKYQPTYTANVLNIYLLAKVTADMLEKGIDVIRRETNYKGLLLQHLVESHAQLSHFVEDSKLRSKTVVVANTEGPSEQWIEALSKKGFVVGNGYGPYKGKQIRIAAFPTHSKEQIELLVDIISGITLS